MSTCATCKHFHTHVVDPQQRITMCRRYPPTTMVTMIPLPPQQQAANDVGMLGVASQFGLQQFTVFPPVSPDLWCGEFTPVIQLSTSMPSGSIRQ